MDFSRMIGQNIIRLASEKYDSLEAIADATGFTAKEIGRIADGRLLLSPDELENIAGFLGTDVSQLISPSEENSAYMECMTNFKDENKKALLLNIIDTYVDLEERIKS